ncbi:alpha/beta fold hydrolase [Streptomyces sp. NPDC001795]|uniref:alpha/beta fold hydrolase n=1 Tax=Streptomyces sp. NPDC001795 TaxID=3154525 RepID=UPI0033237AD8
MALHETEHDTGSRPAAGAAFSFADRLLEELRRRRIRLWVDGGRLHYDAPAHAIDDRILGLLRRHRDTLVQRLLHAEEPTAGPGTPGSQWLRPLKQTPHGTNTVVFVIPAAGSGPSTYRSWAEAAPEGLDVVCVHLPGREERFAEEPYTTVGPLADRIAHEVAGHLADSARPFVLFGHSAGGLIGYEVARRLDSARLKLLAVAASTPPSEAHTADLTDTELLDALRDWGGTPEEALSDSAVRTAVLPRLRADLAVVASCHRPWSEAARLAVPIVVFAGAEDESGTPEDCAAWSHWTTDGFRLHTVPGGHFFPAQQPARLLRTIAETVSGAG